MLFFLQFVYSFVVIFNSFILQYKYKANYLIIKFFIL